MPHSASNPLVSVLMPAYNHASYVRAAVDSVLGQTYSNLELIVIDDASSDGTWEVMQSFKDARVRLYRHETNHGAHATLNEAMGMARGEYVAILNSDDVFARNRLERLLVAAAEVAGDSVFMYSDVEFIDASGVAIDAHERSIGYRALRERCANLRAAMWFLAGNPAISTSNFFFSRDLANKVGGFVALRYTHDWDWALRACGFAEPVWLHEPLLAYRVHATNTLSEDDVWRHVHENSYLQARALGQSEATSSAGESVAFDRCMALLGNTSFHPVPVLIFLLYRLSGVSDSRLEGYAQGEAAAWFLRSIQERAALPEVLFHSISVLAEHESALQAQQRVIEERYTTIRRMSDEIANRDQTIASQAALSEERYAVIQRMSGEIANRDQTIASQAALAEERYATIQRMSGEIASRDRVIAEQQHIIEERWEAMQQMGHEITRRGDTVAKLEREMVILGREMAILEHELSGLRANPCVRVERYVKKHLGKRR